MRRGLSRSLRWVARCGPAVPSKRERDSQIIHRLLACWLHVKMANRSIDIATHLMLLLVISLMLRMARKVLVSVMRQLL